MVNEYGTLHEENGCYFLRFERFFPHSPEEVFNYLTDPNSFTQWYPFATGEMDIRLGGEINFDDGEGSTYKAVITELEKPSKFSLREIDDLINISLREKDEGCQLVFIHTFHDDSWAVNTAAGWHRCLDVFSQIVNGNPITWHDNAANLREIYSEAFKKSL
ncbi:SRPBCC family protein [Ferdinandcohnia sp. Marseille-Q9671]